MWALFEALEIHQEIKLEAIPARELALWDGQRQETCRKAAELRGKHVRYRKAMGAVRKGSGMSGEGAATLNGVGQRRPQ